jgi:hypothetical protein
MGREGQPYPNGTFRTLLNPIKQLIVSRSKLAIYGTSRSMELPAQWNFPLGFLSEAHLFWVSAHQMTKGADGTLFCHSFQSGLFSC